MHITRLSFEKNPNKFKFLRKILIWLIYAGHFASQLSQSRDCEGHVHQSDVIVLMRLHHGSRRHDGPRVVGVEGHGGAQLLERQLVLTCLHVHQAESGAQLRIFGRIAGKILQLWLKNTIHMVLLHMLGLMSLFCPWQRI